jgi:hypothetical protein
MHTPLSQTAETQSQNLLAYLQTYHPTLNDAADTRRLVTTLKKPTTKDYYKLISDHGLRWLPYKWVWIPTVPNRHKFFLWLAFHGRLNTRDNMTRKKWCHDAGCDLCPAVESIEHITLHCKFSSWVWERWNANEAALRSTSIHQFVQGVQENKQGVAAEVWPICFAAGMLNIWKMRNDRIFNNKRANRRKLQCLIAQDITLWSSRTPKLKDELMLWAGLIRD